MKSNITAICCLLLLFSISTSGQRPKKPVVKNPVFTVKEAPVESGDRFFFVIALDKDGNAATSLQNENGPVLTPAESAMFFKRLSRIGDTRLAPTLAPGVIIKPDRSLKYGALVNAVRTARDPSNLRVLVTTDDDTFFLGIEKKPDPKKRPYPDPLTLVVTIEDGELSLNNELYGSLSDPTSLENKLKQIFKDRADNGVFRQGTNLVETAVFVKLPDNSSVAELMKLVKVIRNAGSDTIGLDIDPREIMIRMSESPRT
jgi:biopolymer transport protein ExbD